MNDVLTATLARGQFLSLDECELKRLAVIAHGYQRKLEQIAGAAAVGDFARVRMISKRVLSSHGAKLSAVLRTVKWDSKKAPPLPFSNLIARANALDPSRLTEEPVRLSSRPKPGGGVRLISAFGPDRRAWQRICADILKATLPAYSFEYLRSGQGVEALTRCLLSRLEREQYGYVVTVDIKDCFGSVRKEVVHNLLPIPEWAVRKTMLIDEHTRLQRVVDGNRYVDLLPDDAARRGLPQGASTSGLVMSRAILGPMLATTFFADRLFLHGDNIAVLARNRPEAEAVLEALRSQLENSPAGPLTIGEAAIQPTDRKISLVQYALIPRRALFGGGWRAVPARRSYERFAHRVMERISKGHNGSQIDDYRVRWASSFRLWPRNWFSMSYLRMTAAVSADRARMTLRR
ncbi:MAG TPA: reverse transcriptase domain-containing protein [Reyranella sp.]|jgi:hypothetical protein|nr:reverse transcriptase domain-containing protein [Reyranella sp.]